ncbi:hypothetical protein [Neorhizobium sp. NCHU2750]|uniref:hypothetical protein n=1 Tax=Neorhizobium sp. NCHU2750 TaxID=1825976 RepID=UPI000E7101EA|nr:hypothetical protein NCHU2750_23060 [Neorhizobium sp. NCHU2750]
MTASNSMPSPAASQSPDADSRILQQSELIERLATEMRVASGGELPQSFCISQVKRQLEGKPAEKSPANDRTAAFHQKTAEPDRNSVFHAWALGD